jgi:hypothetical protein
MTERGPRGRSAINGKATVDMALSAQRGKGANPRAWRKDSSDAEVQSADTTPRQQYSATSGRAVAAQGRGIAEAAVGQGGRAAQRDEASSHGSAL